MKSKEQLIKEGNDLLACVKKAYVHGVDIATSRRDGPSQH